jgi:2-keto-4-pentenoate hydratase/2-oxohepta-3-ene-1,7-dioic acid hydratase in catechol pathway
MKLLRYGPIGREKPAILDAEGRLWDLSPVVPDLAGSALDPASLARIREIVPHRERDLKRVSHDVRIGACVGGVGKFICIGLNYSDHAAESGMPIPAEPILFMKATSAVCGPNDDIVIPRGFQKTDWEVELGVVIGRSAKYVSEAEGLSHVAGYCVVNDLSERAFQLEGTGQWVKGKSADTFGPLGPWLVTADEVPDPQNLELWLEVDGRTYQRSTTRHMIFPVARLVSYISRFMSLHPGDVISTGTPPGIGMGQRPPVYLRPGSRMRLGVEGLGEQNQRVIAEQPPPPRAA